MIITFKANTEERRLLDTLAERTGAPSHSEVIRRALHSQAFGLGIDPPAVRTPARRRPAATKKAA